MRFKISKANKDVWIYPSQKIMEKLYFCALWVKQITLFELFISNAGLSIHQWLHRWFDLKMQRSSVSYFFLIVFALNQIWTWSLKGLGHDLKFFLNISIYVNHSNLYNSLQCISGQARKNLAKYECKLES